MMLSKQEKIDAALELAGSFGGIDGGHHKMWVIDQMVLALVGPENYDKWIANYCNGEDGPETWEWDRGIAP